jgi:dienelactone hydrolase
MSVMLKTVRHALSAALLTCSAIAAAQPVTDAAKAEAERAAAQRKAEDALPSTPGDGPYPARMETLPGLANHVIYRPANLAGLGKRKLGVVVWGNGGCSVDGAGARQHLLEIASYGYLVIAPGKVWSGPGAIGKLEQRGPDANGKLPPIATTSRDVLAGLTWALAQNTRPGSPFAGRIDPALTAVAGHSCGGLQALQAASDPRIHAVLIHNSGVFADGSNPIQGMNVDKSILRTLHTPVIYILGGPTDIAYPNGTDDFRKIDSVPAVLVNLPVGHGGTFRRPYGGAVSPVAVDWLEWQLRGDRSAGRTFTGANCRLCNSSAWTIERKKIG